MKGHFNFSHTIQAVDEEQEEGSHSHSDSNLDHLFQIGQDKIDMPQAMEKFISGEDSDQTPNIEQQRKQKKVKKEKKSKKDGGKEEEGEEKGSRKHKHKDKKHKDKKDRKDKGQDSELVE